MTVENIVELPKRHKRYQHREGPPLKERYKVADKRWATSIRDALTHGDVMWAAQLMGVHADKDYRRYL